MTKNLPVHDYSSLAQSLECPRKYYYAVERGLQSHETNVPILAGHAIHEGLDVLYKSGWDVDAAVQRTRDEWNEAGGDDLVPAHCTCDRYCKCKAYLSAAHLEIIIRNYADHYADRPRELYAVGSDLFSERSFRTDLGGLEIGGIVDRLEQDNSGSIELIDTKATTMWSSYWWSKQAKQIDHQLRLYWLALESELDIDISKARIDLIYMGEKADDPPEKWENRSSVPFELSKPITFSPAKLEETRRWIEQATREIERRREDEAEYERDEYAWPQNTRTSFGCSNCQFETLCTSSPHARDGLARARYDERDLTGDLLSGADST